MFPVMLIMMLIFVGMVLYLGKVVVMHLEHQADKDVVRSKVSFQEIIDRKERVVFEKSQLEREASRIFMLYEMTREITKNFNEEESFQIFLKRLKENITIDFCQLIDVGSPKVKEFRDSAEYTLFRLRSKRRKLGYLVIKGVPPEDMDKFTILAHQFSLALRRIKLYKEIERLATTDSLTGVYTRRYFLERFQEEVARSEARGLSLSLLVFDVDHFKPINDQYGHLTGDRVLREIGGIIRNTIREIDIAGRYGGEEFCVVLPEADIQGARFAAERLRTAVEKALIRAYDAQIQLTISVGVATYPQDGRKTNELIDKADWALYRAKKMGRNRICVFGLYDE